MKRPTSPSHRSRLACLAHPAYLALGLFLVAGCGGAGEGHEADAGPAAPAQAPSHEAGGGHGHGHGEEPIGTVTIGDDEVELAQGHGALAAGSMSHLVVKLPYSDRGSTVVRAWIGTEDRTLSYVGKGEYAPSHDDYDVHATAPSPLPDGVMWWIEIEKPDGTVAVGSANPLLD